MADKTIKVPERVHKQIVKIAKANYRGIGDQVEFWAANECHHPIATREKKVVTVTLPENLASGENTVLRFFYCPQCRHNILAEPEPELGQKLDKLVSE